MVTRTDLANAIRALAMDAVQKANSGHPGMPMGMADIAEVLWRHHLSHNPHDPAWANRDRFVLSNGHGSMLLYALLHVTGYALPLEQIEKFRQLHSMTPGHPEIGCAPGVETTTGPLGQGLANAVGMALAERLLAAEFNRPGHDVVDHRTWVFLGDGCLMEGISHEACSLAGTLGLGKLVALYDDNGISIDSEKGSIDAWFSDDTPARFAAYGWHVVRDVDGHDPEAIDAAIRSAIAEDARPTLICCRTVIGKGSPNKANTGAAHGAPLGADEVAAARKELGWNHPPFVIPDEIRQAWDATEAGRKRQDSWNERFAAYAKAFPREATEFRRRMQGELPSGWSDHSADVIATIVQKAESIATRKASQNAIERFAPALPELVGGSADLAASNLTLWSGSQPVGRTGPGNYVFYGVREFGMAAIMNGLSLHGGFIPYGGTFLVFSDYARNAIRLASLMKRRVVFVLTHDSIGLGEDGPTHQPVEHAASLRVIPNLDVWRPCDAVETAVAWKMSLERADGPTAHLLSRQNLPHQARTADQIEAIRRGGYTLSESSTGHVDIVLIATGSEVALAMQAQAELKEAGVGARVVSMPSTTVFDRQDDVWKRSVLPPGVRRVSVEAGVTDCWYKYVGLDGAAIGIDRFGESAPGGELFKYFGFTAQHVVTAAREVLSRR
ncbi:MAG: transketolase [Betaproteobacteria bacterium]|nr:transketolase [Betaproteobacteria bacterium]